MRTAVLITTKTGKVLILSVYKNLLLIKKIYGRIGGGGGLSDKCTYMYAHLYILL